MSQSSNGNGSRLSVISDSSASDSSASDSPPAARNRVDTTPPSQSLGPLSQDLPASRKVYSRPEAAPV